MVARAVDPVEVGSMKHLYFRLCNPILIDGGRMGFFVDRKTGVKCFILPARELCIKWEEDTSRYWKWIHHPESRFSEVAELSFIWSLDIKGKINSRMLSKWSNYSAYLVFKLLNSASGLSHPLQKVSVTVGGAPVSGFSVRLMEAQVQAQRDRGMVGKPQTRQDGWMEILLGKFYNEEGDDGDVVMSFSEMEGNCKRGLIVQGIEIRP